MVDLQSEVFGTGDSSNTAALVPRNARKQTRNPPLDFEKGASHNQTHRFFGSICFSPHGLVQMLQFYLRHFGKNPIWSTMPC